MVKLITLIKYVLFFAVIFYPKSTGKMQAMFKGFSFYRHDIMKVTDRWHCTCKNSRGCKAFFIATKEAAIIRANVDHNHEPPSFVIKNGIFIKLGR